METTDLRALLREYRKAVAERDAAGAEYDRGERDRKVRRLMGEPEPPNACDDADARLDAFVERYHAPVDRIIGQMRAVCLLLHDGDPFGKFDRPRAVVVDGALLVVHDPGDACSDGFAVVEPADVLTLPAVEAAAKGA